MKKVALIAALCLVPMVPTVGAVDKATEDMALTLTSINGKIWGGLEAKKRFEFLLPRMTSMCSDIRSVTDAGDKIAYGWKQLREAGLGNRESILDFSNNVYDVSHAVYIGTGGQGPVKCVSIWIAYMVLRLQGNPIEASKQHVMRGGVLAGRE